MMSRPTPAPRPPRRMVRPPSIHDKRKPSKPKHHCCNAPKPEVDDRGATVCMNCYAELQAQNDIVAEVQFSEDAGGRATAQGGFVTNDARHANTLGAGARRLGGSDRDPGQNASANARRILSGLCPRLNLSDTIKAQAVTLYGLASASNFSAGRKTDEVVAACLYAVCRRQKENQVLLIDISELQRINVFRLGEVYKALCKDVYLEMNGKSSTDKIVGEQHRLEVESLIMKYCRKLEFGDKTRQVAEDAARILRRMKRDWIVTGRHPAGLCGACIIYAARMNNFRRTKREVVYVARIGDQTVAARMKEFQATRTAAMSVEQFREKALLVKETHEPPAMGWSKVRRRAFENKKRKRQGLAPLRDDEEPFEPGQHSAVAQQRQIISGSAVASATPEPADDNGEGSRKRQRMADGSPATPAPTQQEPRLDQDGFAVPFIPASVMRQQEQGSQQQTDEQDDQDGQELAAQVELPKKRGRKPYKEMWCPSDDDLMAEAELEREIEDMLQKDSGDDSLRAAQAQLDEDKAKERDEERERRERGDPEADKERERQKEKEKEAQRAGRTVTFQDQSSEADGEPQPMEIVTAESLEAEFANDLEVMNCLLPEKEQKVKEQIWVAENEDWMRVQVAKEISKRLNQEHRKEKGRKGAKPGRRKKSRMGDGSTIAEATTPIETPIDANRAMFERRGVPKAISKHINYEALKSAYARNPSSTSQSRDTSEAPTSREESVAPSQADGEEDETAEDGQSTPPPTQGVQKNGVASSPAADDANGLGAPRSPPTTHDQATTGAEQEDEEDDGQGDPSDYVQEEDLDYGSDDEARGGNWLGGDDDDREDIGEDEWGPLSRNALPQYGEDDGDDY